MKIKPHIPFLMFSIHNKIVPYLVKSIYVIVINVIFTHAVKADCISDNEVNIYPQEYYVNQNALFMVEEYYGLSSAVVSLLNKQIKVFLVSEKERVELEVAQVYNGAFNITQAILKPKTVLKPGTEYYTEILETKITNGPKGVSAPMYGLYKKYKIKYSSDFKTPKIIEPPLLSKSTLQFYGCGVHESVTYKCLIADESEVYVRTKVKSLKSKKVSEYFLKIKNGEVEIGRNMCSGAFEFNDGNYYQVELEFFDLCGNSTKYEKKLYFEKPKNKDKVF